MNYECSIIMLLLSCSVMPKKVRLVKAMVFPVVMYECKSWTVKKAERWRIDAFFFFFFFNFILFLNFT